MLQAVLPIRTLLLAIFMMMAGTGFLATLLSVRMERDGISSLLIGLVATAYFLGLTIGSLRAASVIQRVGHIRSFASFVSIYSASTLAYAIHQDVMFWSMLRFVDGFCMAGVFICLESWLNEKAEVSTRGAILASYMVATFSGQAIGQLLLTTGEHLPSLPFMLAAIVLSLAVVPVALTRISQPGLGDQPSFSLRRLYDISPLGVTGAMAAGVMLGAFYGLGAVYAAKLGLTLTATAFFMTVVISGGVLLQWPLGWLSDRYDRRLVIVGCFAATFVVCMALTFVASPGLTLLILAMAFGGIAFALYPLCVSHANDQVELDERVGASGGLVLVYSVGAAIGPLFAAATMTVFGGPGLFLFIGVCAGGAALFAYWRHWIGSPIPTEAQQPFQSFPNTTPMSATLDPTPESEAEDSADAAAS
ncbi:MFS transporter [Methyloligella sp. 2.7D]|uniref:MFS transporter n=1 Tax=unclassified Methyloligella TaxID=2625955 RepID=UPI00157DC2F6|nr:MFS transporter [Methyloligella sp. GL2]QKP76026.1 MFS transporter [Methyloligella sp. GL2]